MSCATPRKESRRPSRTDTSRRNPYAPLEGLLIAAQVVGAKEIYLAAKASPTRELAGLRRALDEMTGVGVVGDVSVRIVRLPWSGRSPRFVDFDGDTRSYRYDSHQRHRQPDWTYRVEPAAGDPKGVWAEQAASA